MANGRSRRHEAATISGTTPGDIPLLISANSYWRAYWLFPIPNTDLYMWPNFRSPLVWDVFAVSTYATVSALFWYVGLVPDLATLRDRAKNFSKYVYGALSLGWRGSAHHAVPRRAATSSSAR